MFKKAMEHILKVEGSRYTEHKADRGGPTKYGITLLTLENYRKKVLKPDDVRRLTKGEATRIYQELYWNRLKLDNVRNEIIALVIFDCAVNCGLRFATNLTQSSINCSDPWQKVEVDGVMGPITMAALNMINPKLFGFYFFKGVQSRYIGIVKKDPSQLVFLQGWINRSYLTMEVFL